MTPFLAASRLYLRNLRPEDAAAMAAYRSDPRCAQFQRWEIKTTEALRPWISRFAECRFPSQEREQHYALCLLSSGELVGDLTVFYTAEDACFTLGITIATAHQRHGYAYEILHAVTQVLRTHAPGIDLVALIERENAASIRLFEKLGFQQECYAESIHSLVYVLPGTPSETAAHQ